MNTYTATIEVDELGELVLPIPAEALIEAGWKAGDVISWENNGDGSFSLTKVLPKTVWVMVECITSQRSRYMVEVLEGKTIAALSIVSKNDARVFSRQLLSDTVISHHIITKEGAMDLCRRDHPHKSRLTDEELEWVHFTEMKND